MLPGVSEFAALPPKPVGSHLRRTASIAFADIVGYSTLMSVDGERTHLRWMSLLHGTLGPLARARGSRLIKSTGDGVLAEFATVDDAFAWALEVQNAVRATDDPAGPPLAFRIGIHFGDVYTTAEDVYGHTANVAARLQEHAPPGGIALTEAARDLLSKPPPLRMLGRVTLRSMQTGVRALLWDPPVPVRTPRRPVPSGVPSIAIMPLENLGGKVRDLYFASGIVDDIVNSLAALQQLSVVARSATVGWPASVACDAPAIGRYLGVRYAVCGSVRRKRGGVRLFVDLRETELGDRIWADTIEAADHELFDAQDEIVRRVATKLAPALHAAELRRALRRRPDSLTAYDLTLRGMYSLDFLERASFADARAHFERAMAEDPGYAMPVAWAGQWHSLAVGQAWSSQPDTDAREAGRLAHRAIQLDPANPLGFAIAGHHTAYHLRDPASALPLFDAALEICPSHALSWAFRGTSLAYLGRGEEAVQSARRGFDLSPLGPSRFYFQTFVAQAHYVAGQYEDTVRWVTMALRDSPAYSSAYRLLAASLAGLGRLDEAAHAAKRLMECEPAFRLSVYQRTRAPFVVPELQSQWVGHLRAAGVPD